MKALRMSKALGLLACLAYLGTAVAQESGIDMQVLLKSGESWNGAALPAYPDGPPEITIARITIPPGTALPEHLHTVINGGILLSGELTVRTEQGQEHHLAAGEPLLEVVNTWHAGRNEGTEPAVAVVFYVGTPGLPVTKLKEPPVQAAED